MDYPIRAPTLAIATGCGILILWVMRAQAHHYQLVFCVLAVAWILSIFVRRDLRAQTSQRQSKDALMQLLSKHASHPRVVEYMHATPALSVPLTQFAEEYAWIDTHECDRILKATLQFTELYAMCLFAPPQRRAIVEDSMLELQDIKREILNALASYVVRETSVLQDARFEHMTHSLHAALSSMLKTLAYKHPYVDHKTPLPYESYDDPHNQY